MLMSGMTRRMALCTTTVKSTNALVGVNGMCSWSRLKNVHKLVFS
jgi:hypothetical protein